MGRKDAGHSPNMAPVDHHRKQIGKHEWKKNKKEMKEAKRQMETKKSSRGLQDMLLMLVAFVAVMAAVYFLVYVYLQGEEGPADNPTT